MSQPSLTPDRLSRLIAAAAAVAGQPDLTAVLQTTVDTARELTGAKYAALGVLGAHGGLAEFIYVGVDASTADLIGHLPVGRGVLGTITKSGEVIRIDEISDHADSVGFPAHHPHPSRAPQGQAPWSESCCRSNEQLDDRIGPIMRDPRLSRSGPS